MMKTKSILINADNDRPHRSNPLLASLGSLQSREGVMLRFSHFFTYLPLHHVFLTSPSRFPLLFLIPFSMHFPHAQQLRLLRNMCFPYDYHMLTDHSPCLTHMPQWLRLLRPHVFLAATTLQTSIYTQLVTYLFLS